MLGYIQYGANEHLGLQPSFGDGEKLHVAWVGCGGVEVGQDTGLWGSSGEIGNRVFYVVWV